MARSNTTDAAESTTAAQARFVVSLPRELGTAIDLLAAMMAEQMRSQFGVGVELSRAQVVTSVVQSALKTFEELQTAPSTNGTQES